MSTLSATKASPPGWERESKDARDVEAKASRESNSPDEGLDLMAADQAGSEVDPLQVYLQEIRCIPLLSPEQELVQDLITITHCFSSRLYGLRNYRKALEKALKDDQSAQNPASSNT